MDLLLVDDEPGILRALGRVLAEVEGLRVESVTDPREAAALLRERPPRILLTDYRMPGLTGLELLKEARRAAPNTIRILLTGQADRAHIIEAINVGHIFRFLEKPWDDDELRAVVREALEAHKARRAAHALRRAAETASGVQRGFLPQRPAGGQAAVLMTPHEYASGDYVDVLDLPGGRTALVMGDVCGHGLGAALFATAARALIHAGLADGRDPVAVIERTNRFLCRDMPDGRFLTLFLGVHDPARETLWYVNAGQSPPLVLVGDEVFELGGTGFPLGLDDRAAYAASEEVPLRPGQTLLAYTDGLIEARSGVGEFFGTERLMQLLRAQGPEIALEVLVERVRDDACAFAGPDGVSDDLALLAYRPSPAPALAGRP